MDPIKKGTMTERALVRELQYLKDHSSELVSGFRVSPPAVDGRGMDNLVLIKLPKGLLKSEMTVPLEAKTSYFGVREWRVKHSDLSDAGVLIVYRPWWIGRRKFRRTIYRALDSVRHNSRGGMLYHSMWQRLFIGGSHRLYENIAKIKTRRAVEKSRMKKRK